MTKNLKVKVLKKSKDAPYPEHIIVERKSTHEMVHLYFDDGNLTRLTHITRAPKIEGNQNTEGKNSLPNYVISQDIVYKTDEKGQKKPYFLKGLKNQNFFALIDTSLGERSSIGFKSNPEEFTDSYVEMTANKKCIPNAYWADCGVADVNEIYPHQERKVSPLSKAIVKGQVKSR